MEVLPRCGHCVHEDAPDKVSNHTVPPPEDLLMTPLSVSLSSWTIFKTKRSCSSWLQVAEVLATFLLRLKLTTAKENFLR